MGGSLVFVAVFVLVTIGSAVVTLNAKFLGAKLSFFQIVCVLGYCTAPMVLVALISLGLGKLWYAKLILAIRVYLVDLRRFEILPRHSGAGTRSSRCVPA